MKGRTTDVEFWKNLYGAATCNWGNYNSYGPNYGSGYNELDFNSKPSKRRHEFSPVLLVYTTVFDCKHCGRKKEDCSYDYCSDEDSPPDTWDIGGW